MTRMRFHEKHGFFYFGTLFMASLLTSAGSAPMTGQTAPLFPTPFVVEHHVVQNGHDGTSTATETVTDYYGGSWLASVRPDGSRLVVDFSRRELTEVRPEDSTYTNVSFERCAELRARMRALSLATVESGRPGGVSQEARGTAAGGVHAIAVTPLGGVAPRGPGVAATTAASASTVIQMRVTAGPEAPPIEVWCDRRILLGERARAALSALESEVLGAGGSRRTSSMLAAARDHAGGAFPVRTLRRTGTGEHSPTIEDVATRLEALDRFPDELLRIPDGYRRVAHPLEVMVDFEEQEAALARGERPRR